MAHEIISDQSKQPGSKIHALLNNPGVVVGDQTNAKRTRFLAFLKSKYGYTNEKSVGELERLLKQFYSTNRSLGIHRARLSYKHLSAD